MKFVTSYYANKDIPDEYIKVSISGGLADYIEVHHWDTRLAPKKSFFMKYKNSVPGEIREREYIKEFKRLVLVEVQLNDIFKEWSDKFGKNKTFCIMCYETPEDFCHRQLVAEAIEKKYSIEVPEINVEKDTKREDGKFQSTIQIDEEEW